MSIKTAVIGAGHLGRIHAKLLKQIGDVEVVAVADPCSTARQKIETELGLKTTDNWQELIGKIDAAVVAAPTSLHHEIAAELAGNDIHLLIEKPVTTTVAQARHLSRIANARNCMIQVGHVERFNAASEGATSVGIPRFIQTCRASGYTFRSIDVGVVLDLMIHDIDLVCNLAQSPVVDVQAVGISVFGKHEDIAQARLQFENGLVANLTASRCSPTPSRRFEVYGSNGYVDIDLANSSAKQIKPPTWIVNRSFDLDSVTDQQRDLIRESLFEKIMPVEELQFEPVNAILCEQQNWVDCILGRSQKLAVPIDDGLRALETATEIVSQINSHQWNKSGTVSGPLCDPAMIDQPELGLVKRAA